MTVKCKICGKEFEAQQKNHNLCSPECRKISHDACRRAWWENNREEQRRKAREYCRKKAKPVYCKFCGKPVEAHVTPVGQHRRNRYHSECLIDAAIEAILRGEKFNNKRSKNVLAYAVNKGYSKRELLEIMEERGIECG